MNLRFPKQLRQSGFTLVELMVSLVIGLLIVLGLIALLVNVNRSNNEMAKTNRVIENGRFALQMLESDIVHAGYWGGFVPSFNDLSTTADPTDFPSAVPDPCLAYASGGLPPYPATHLSNLIGIAVQAYEIPAIVPSPTLAVCANVVTSPKGRTDVLFVRHVELCVPGDGSCPAVAKPEELYFQVDQCGDAAGSPTYAWKPYPAAATNAPSIFPNKKRSANCTTGGYADIRKFVSNLYYVRDYAATAGDGIPTLMRSEFGLSPAGLLGHKAPEALIEGIEGFRIELGIDTLSDNGTDIITGTPPAGAASAALTQNASIKWADGQNLTSPKNRGDGIPDGSFVRCTSAAPCTVDQLANVTVVKLYVLARSDTTTPGYTDTKIYAMGSTSLGPFNDSYKRHLYTQTIRLTNIASRRETP